MSSSFSSFPPSFASFPDLAREPSPSLATSEKDVKRKKSTRSDKKHEDKRASKNHRRKHAHANEHHTEKDVLGTNGEPTPVSSTSKPNESVRINTIFFIDRTGDKANLQYGGLHTGDVPKHHLVAGGKNILGLSRALIALRRTGKTVEVGPGHYHSKASSITDSASRAILLRPPSRRIIPLTETNKYEEDDGFIRLPSRRTQLLPEVESYRSISLRVGIDDSDSSLPSDIEGNASSDDDSDHPILPAHQESLKLLDQELAHNPGSTKTWLSLLRQTLSTIPITSKNAPRARSEITVSILTRALSAAPENARSKQLLIPYLKAGEEIWHESKLRSEWEEALRVGGIDIYMEWLEWQIRRGRDGVDGVIECARRVLGSLGDDVNSEIVKIRVLWRVAIVLHDAGFCERAMSLLQAQAELLFNMPSALANMTFQEKLTELEIFWESEVPRLGEDSSLGWAAWYQSKDSHQLTSSRQPIQTPNISDLDPYRQWANQEIASARTMRFSLRSDTEVSDPYCVVIFSDIQDMVVDVKSRAAKHAFRMAWLSFIGLHTPGLTLADTAAPNWDDRWNLGYLTMPSKLDKIFPSDENQRLLSTDTVAGVVIGRQRAYLSPFGPVQCWGHGVSGPLDYTSSDPSKPFRKGIWSEVDLQNVDKELARRLFLRLKLDGDDAEWNSLALAFEVAIDSKSAVKMSKSLLSHHQNSLRLWNAHAQLDRMRGRLNEARKVYQTVLINKTSTQMQMQQQTSVMWWNWAEMEWLSDEDEAALGVVLKSVDLQGSHSGITILRAKRSLDDNAKSSTGWKEQEGWIKLRILLELLTGNAPSEALKVFDERFLHLEGTAAKESLTTASLMMIYSYGTTLKRPMPPSLLRDRAHSAFEAYPNNSIILAILLESERGQAVWGRIRSLMGAIDSQSKDVARRIQEVWIAGWEKGRWASEVERTRSGLAAAIEHERTSASPVIWRIYIEFEIRERELQRAKKLLFRAISECPLVKDLYLLAFGPLRSVFQAQELNTLADTMVERGIRLHQSLDEVVNVINERDDRENEPDENSEDEIEHRARELRRLMPY